MLQAPPAVHEKASTLLSDSTPEALDILWGIARWYTGTLIEHDDQPYHIGWHRPPALKTLLGCSETAWERRYEPAVRSLRRAETTPTLSAGVPEDTSQEAWLTDRYLLRRKVRWTPTERARNVMSKLFADQFDEQEYPQQTGQRGPIGTWEGTLRHRTGVAIVAAIWRQQGYAVASDPGESAGPDLQARGPSGRWACVVVPDSVDHQLQRSRLKTCAEKSNRTNLWLFTNRAAAVETLNRLHETDHLDYRLVNAPYDTPENYSTQVINRYISQSQTEPHYQCPGIDRVDTITGWYERFYDDDAHAQLAATL